jgi:hypothetical protein
LISADPSPEPASITEFLRKVRQIRANAAIDDGVLAEDQADNSIGSNNNGILAGKNP